MINTTTSTHEIPAHGQNLKIEAQLQPALKWVNVKCTIYFWEVGGNNFGSVEKSRHVSGRERRYCARVNCESELGGVKVSIAIIL